MGCCRLTWGKVEAFNRHIPTVWYFTHWGKWVARSLECYGAGSMFNTMGLSVPTTNSHTRPYHDITHSFPSKAIPICPFERKTVSRLLQRYAFCWESETKHEARPQIYILSVLWSLKQVNTYNKIWQYFLNTSS